MREEGGVVGEERRRGKKGDREEGGEVRGKENKDGGGLCEGGWGKAGRVKGSGRGGAGREGGGGSEGGALIARGKTEEELKNGETER